MRLCFLGHFFIFVPKREMQKGDKERKEEEEEKERTAKFLQSGSRYTCNNLLCEYKFIDASAFLAAIYELAFDFVIL